MVPTNIWKEKARDAREETGKKDRGRKNSGGIST